jgi:hypothetical protein
MPVMPLSQARVADPVLTNVVQGYKQAQFVASFLSPSVPVSLRSGKVVEFGKEDFVLYQTKRSPGGTVQRKRSRFGSRSFELYQDAIAEEVTLEEAEEAANGAARVNLRTNAPKRAMKTIMLTLEKDTADVMQTAAKYETANTIALGVSDRWDNYGSSASNPLQDVNGWKEAVRDQIGIYPNRMVIGPKVFLALKEHPLIVERIKYTSSDSVTLGMIAKYFDLPGGVMVGAGKFLDDSGNLADIWGKNAILAYVPEEAENSMGYLMPQPGIDKETPAYSYTYVLDGYPMAEPERWDADKGVFVYPVWAERVPELVGMGATGKVGAGFLGTTLVS